MEASDMLDLIHFYFEDDNSFSSEEQMKSRSKIRESVYANMYGTIYKYKYEEKSKTSTSYDTDYDDYEPLSEEESLKPFDPKAEATKPYIEPTYFDPESDDPFAGKLDRPLR